MDVHRLKVGDSIRVEELEQKLGELHYQPVSAVSAPGQYALRGPAFDIFPVSYLFQKQNASTNQLFKEKN